MSTVTKNPRRLAAEQIILDTIATCTKNSDHEKYNLNRYTRMFSEMTDEMFDDYMHRMRAGEARLEIYAPNLKIMLQVDDLIAACDKLGVALLERIRMYNSAAKRWFTTPKKYLVLYLPVRRVSQSLAHKISVPEGDSKIDLYTGQVVKPDKGSSISLVETQNLDAAGLGHTISEFINIRGGNPAAWAALKAQLEETGSGSLSAKAATAKVRATVVAATTLRTMGIDNNLEG